MADAPKITPITIKPIAIKPMAPKPAAPAAAPAPAPAAPAAAGPAIKPIVIAPAAAGKPLSADGNTATIRLSPAPAAPASAPAPAPAAPKPIAIKPAITPAPAPAAAPDETAPTVAIKPIAIKPKVVAPASTAAAKPVAPNAQAMKSTTSRISLDSALAQPPTQAAPAAMGKITSNLTQAGIDAAKGRTAKASLTIQDGDDITRHQTIRVKAPGAAPAAPAPEAPVVAPAAADAAKPAMPADASEAPTVRKKSLVLKKPGGAGAPSGAPTKPTLKLKADPGAPKPADGAAPAAGGGIAEGTGAGGGLDDIEAPPAAMSQGGALQAAAPKKKTHWIFPVVAFLDIAALIAVIVVFMAETCGPDRCLTDYTTYKGLFDSPLALGGSVLVN